MKSLTIAVAVTGAVLGFAAQAQDACGAKLFFEGDMVRGGQAGAPGPVCVLDNQFKHLEKIVWPLLELRPHGGRGPVVQRNTASPADEVRRADEHLRAA